MDNIERTLGQLFEGRDFEKEYQGLKQQVLHYQPIQDFFKEHKEDITEQLVNQNLSNLYEFMTQHKKFTEQEETLMPGYAPKLVLNGEFITVTYYPTKEKIEEDKRRAVERRFHSLYMPKQVLEANLDNFYVDENSRYLARVEAYKFLDDYIVKKGNYVKGLFIHGSFGTGKSYLLGALAKELALKGISTTLVYLPEFMREVKQSISDNTVGEKIQFAKETEVLMLDDIGAESMTAWTRDEVLGAILQFRMQEELPTFFSSNYNMDQLENHLMFAQNGTEEKLKARRIMERVRYLSKEVNLEGKNRRF
ncbi:primosomal protein DnaI [Listeria cossartiae subsp. cayugensis]|uniref:primosomal protein DnaI n=1 Tax=Listeria cossartiae TaxID=2838249 RepID=UPI00288057CE|nr:primosomal protein DnaI [Listeria cossartiae]MDT0003182.1 primosomal protein DnaI [Listeria cossartiae subsp. cayugensis]MDT0018450.1 primosomal protein DnaI [Listeria cossartiae subsp. cayugensis]MDT0035977.1 primosomal protein DnaI [Listeria cossartiae subsp. cayugensis]MDT0040200.1 primosomal protein DnaI [Listeria cossartiae subsp. cayugensis]MDT0046679.1 primosomal protein DnaI [Listeria cossartiae subsp. cayugensis]